MADVFVSYHKKDRERAEQAVASLDAHGYSVWWDDRVTPMESWDKTVEREIDQARCVLVLWTKESVESDWVRIEANFAKMAHPRKLVQVRIEDCRIPMNFSMIQYIDALGTNFDPGSDEGWEKALEWVGLFAGAAPVRAEAPAPKPRKRKVRKAKEPSSEPAAVEAAPAQPPPSVELKPPAAPAFTAPPPEPPPAPRAEPTPQPAMHAFTAPPPPPRIDYEAAIRRAFSGVTAHAERLVNTGSYWRRGLIAAVIGCIAGALLFMLCINTGLYDDGATWFYIGFLLLRVTVACAVGYVLVRTDRLTAPRAGILVAAMAVLTIVVVGAPVLASQTMPEGTAVFLIDLIVLGLLWLLARQLGAFRAPRTNWRLPVASSGAFAIYALAVGIGVANGATPSFMDVVARPSMDALRLLLECCVLLALFEPARATAR